MKKIFVLATVILLINCTVKDHNEVIIKQPGLYKFDSNILNVKEFTDGTIAYWVTYQNEVLCQSNLSINFSKYSYWSIFIEGLNVWSYNSDYNQYEAWLFNEESNIYEKFNFCEDDITIPLIYKSELEKKISKICW